MQIKISSETADSLVVDILRNTYEGLTEDNIELLAKKSLEKYEEDDLKNNTEMLLHLEKVLRYFSPQTEHNEWLKKVNENGKVEK